MAWFQYFSTGSDIRTYFLHFLNFGKSRFSPKKKFYNLDYRLENVLPLIFWRSILWFKMVNKRWSLLINLKRLILTSVVLEAFVLYKQKLFIAVAQWICLHLPSCRPGFESQAHHLHFYQFEFEWWRVEKTKINRKRGLAHLKNLFINSIGTGRMYTKLPESHKNISH